MVSSALAFIAVLASAFVTRAEVIPSEPSPGSIFNEGQNCRVSWNGDPESTATWKSMAIELMTGDNFNMIHLTSELYPPLMVLTFHLCSISSWHDFRWYSGRTTRVPLSRCTLNPIRLFAIPHKQHIRSPLTLLSTSINSLLP